MTRKRLTEKRFKSEIGDFTAEIANEGITELYGVTDGKAIGTYSEHRLQGYLGERYEYESGSSASGIDFPDIQVDLKVTSITQPQSSCPFRNAAQKVYGLGYNLLVFVYDKADDDKIKKTKLVFKAAIFIEKEYTADYQTTSGIAGIIERKGNIDDLAAFLEERNFPLDEIGRRDLANRIFINPPEIGYLTISNALQWRLQYSRAISFAEKRDKTGITGLLK